MKRFVSLKAYGDVVIACNSLRGQDKLTNQLVCGRYLKPLLDAIEYEGNVIYLDLECEQVPAIFDIQKQGLINAISSTFMIRRSLLAICDNNDQLVFDRVGFREHLIANGRDIVGIKGDKSNIYLDYQSFFLNHIDFNQRKVTREILNIGIFPNSRHLRKELNESLILALVLECQKLGFDAHVVYVTNQPYVNFSFSSLCISGFDSLVKSIKEFDLIVSADSLPAHIAEYFGINVFVFSPVDNHYWLPKSAFLNGAYAKFDEVIKFKKWLARIKRIIK